MLILFYLLGAPLLVVYCLLWAEQQSWGGLPRQQPLGHHRRVHQPQQQEQQQVLPRPVVQREPQLDDWEHPAPHWERCSPVLCGRGGLRRVPQWFCYIRAGFKLILISLFFLKVLIELSCINNMLLIQSRNCNYHHGFHPTTVRIKFYPKNCNFCPAYIQFLTLSRCARFLLDAASRSSITKNLPLSSHRSLQFNNANVWVRSTLCDKSTDWNVCSLSTMDSRQSTSWPKCVLSGCIAKNSSAILNGDFLQDEFCERVGCRVSQARCHFNPLLDWGSPSWPPSVAGQGSLYSF